jgi:hypothetical protein
MGVTRHWDADDWRKWALNLVGSASTERSARRTIERAVQAALERQPPEGAVEALRKMSRDMHRTSTRPCGTCSEITATLGEPFGCVAYNQQRGQQ